MLDTTMVDVLLVDDDPNDEELAKVAFEETKIPHRLTVKRDGAETIEWLKQIDEDGKWPDLILLDLKLPKVNGLEVLQHLRSSEKSKFIPVVIFTSSLEHKDVSRSYDLGANAYIRKPIDFQEYRHTISDIGRFWILRNRPAPRRSELK